MDNGLCYVSDRRDEEETWGEHDLLFNIVLASLHERTKFGVIKRKIECKAAQDMVDKLRIETSGLDKLICFLSGGNQAEGCACPLPACEP